MSRLGVNRVGPLACRAAGDVRHTRDSRGMCTPPHPRKGVACTSTHGARTGGHVRSLRAAVDLARPGRPARAGGRPARCHWPPAWPSVAMAVSTDVGPPPRAAAVAVVVPLRRPGAGAHRRPGHARPAGRRRGVRADLRPVRRRGLPLPLLPGGVARSSPRTSPRRPSCARCAASTPSTGRARTSGPGSSPSPATW